MEAVGVRFVAMIVAVMHWNFIMPILQKRIWRFPIWFDPQLGESER